jgi:hypothetical protein
VPPVCSICNSPRREEIDAALRSGEALLRIAKNFDIPETNLRRHRDKHNPQLLVESKRARAEHFFQRVEFLSKEAKRLQGLAEKSGDYKTALAGVRELTRLLELNAKAAGELRDRQIAVLNMNVNLDETTARKIAETYLERARLREVKTHVLEQ